MKNVCSLFLSLFIVSLIASCDSSTGPSEEGQRIGTFMVYAKKANWVGVQGSAKAKTNAITHAEGDTIFLSQPDGKNFYMVDKGATIRFFLEDSSYNNQDSFHAELKNPLTPNTSYGYGPRNDHIQFYGDVPVNCDSTYGSTENVTITYWERAGDEDQQVRGDTLEIISLKTDGIVESAKSIHCN